jgi:hypothetical protein
MMGSDEVVEFLELTGPERVAVKNAVSTWRHCKEANPRDYHYNDAVVMIVGAINRVRAGGEPG